MSEFDVQPIRPNRHVKQRYGFDSIIAQNPEMRAILESVKRLAASEVSPIMLQGESGTGKDLIAHVIHHESRRAHAPFMVVNCAALPRHLLQMELFGQESESSEDTRILKTGQLELANGGTVYLDEVNRLDPASQARLMQFFETKSLKRPGGARDLHTDVRTIAASSVELARAVQAGDLRQDLFARLKRDRVRLSPLRNRRDDIIPLVRYYLECHSAQFGKCVTKISPEAEKAFLQYDWPGNIRELRNIVERTVLLESGDTIALETLPADLLMKPAALSPVNLDIEIPDDGLPLEQVERIVLTKTLEKCKYNQAQAARILLISADTLLSLMKKYDLL